MPLLQQAQHENRYTSAYATAKMKTSLHMGFLFIFIFFFFFDLQPFQEYMYFTYIEPIIHQRWVKTGELREKPPDHP